MRVKLIALEMHRNGRKIHECYFVTSNLDTRQNVKYLTDSARSLWKIENEIFNEFKNKGHHLEQNFRLGQKLLANVLLAFNFITFHTACN